MPRWNTRQARSSRSPYAWTAVTGSGNGGQPVDAEVDGVSHGRFGYAGVARRVTVRSRDWDVGSWPG
jgi:hypothetical protein